LCERDLARMRDMRVRKKQKNLLAEISVRTDFLLDDRRQFCLLAVQRIVDLRRVLLVFRRRGHAGWGGSTERRAFSEREREMGCARWAAAMIVVGRAVKLGGEIKIKRKWRYIKDNLDRHKSVDPVPKCCVASLRRSRRAASCRRPSRVQRPSRPPLPPLSHHLPLPLPLPLHLHLPLPLIIALCLAPKPTPTPRPTLTTALRAPPTPSDSSAQCRRQSSAPHTSTRRRR
jgi:hypothetical protein